ncbi:hypothetical protein L1049_003535 [Liquidambar formosana]|uniref:Uncharacterized protein n=1 Tax=Liquidambar formosana TaxID=63359 RepID=A0AAP0N3A4_LIQFO
MTATSDEEMETLLSSVDHIYDDFNKGMTEIQLLKSKCNAEIRRREALEIACNSLKLDNGRLTKLHTKSLNKLADQLEQRVKYQGLEEELKRASDERLSREDGHRKAMELLKQDHATKVGDLEIQIGGFLLQKAANEATINHLRQDLAAHKIRIHALTNRLECVRSDVEAKYHHEIQDLKDCLLVEQEEKNELNKKLHNFEKELLLCRTKLVEQQRDLTLNRHVGAFKEKIMKLRKENEILKRQLLGSKEG